MMYKNKHIDSEKDIEEVKNDKSRMVTTKQC
jgi:hypothetical protein